jgi:hypothetical protein
VPKPWTRWERFQEWMGWHAPSDVRYVNFASANGTAARCRRCGRVLLMDAQGNWFAL